MLYKVMSQGRMSKRLRGWQKCIGALAGEILPVSRAPKGEAGEDEVDSRLLELQHLARRRSALRETHNLFFRRTRETCVMMMMI